MANENGLLAGKRGLIMGVANDKSIAWAIARTCRDAGADLAFTYQGDALHRRVAPLAEQVGSAHVLPCDVTAPSSIDAVFERLDADWGSLDFLVHAIAFSDKEELRGRYVDTSPDNFALTLNVSCYSFTAVAQRAEKLLAKGDAPGGSLLTLTYYGAERVMPHYNVMGVAKAALEASVRYMAMDLGPSNIRVNALSAGPMKTLAAAGIGDFRYISKVERAELAHAPECQPDGCRRRRPVLVEPPLVRRHRRDPSCRLRLSRRRHEGRRRARYRNNVNQNDIAA